MKPTRKRGNSAYLRRTGRGAAKRKRKRGKKKALGSGAVLIGSIKKKKRKEPAKEEGKSSRMDN